MDTAIKHIYCTFNSATLCTSSMFGVQSEVNSTGPNNTARNVSARAAADTSNISLSRACSHVGHVGIASMIRWLQSLPFFRHPVFHTLRLPTQSGVLDLKQPNKQMKTNPQI
eukprot:3534520-Amphidinium_carterae.1